MQKSNLYVCEAKSLTSALPLIRVDNFEQADIVREHLKKIMPEMRVSYFGTPDEIDVPHFSEYTWN